MKNPKNRLYRAIVIGATPAGIAATNKLVELGIPVTLIDSDSDLDYKLSRDEWRLKSGIPLNHAQRFGLIRILRNPNIRCIMPAELTSINHTRQGFRVRFKRLQTFVDPDRCTLCGRCVEICPVSVSGGGKAVNINTRLSLPGRPFIDKRRQPLCQESCPLGVNAQGYITLARTGKFAEALELVRKNNVLPGICGRICTHPCENACRRGELDEPIAIRDIKRFIADYEFSAMGEIKPADAPVTNIDEKTKKIAVIGSGPAGLAAAADLAGYGYRVTVFEKEKMAGGLLRYGIGAHRLPREILDFELAYIEKLGVQFVTSHAVDLVHGLEPLTKDFDAVIVSTGAWSDRKLGIPGENLAEVEGCLSFLGRFHRGEITRLKEKVAVIGDGNAAFDLARTLSRLGADVTILSWFPADLIPADPEEIKASQEEGIAIRYRIRVIEFIDQNGKLDRLRCKPTQPGQPDAQGIPWPVTVPKSKPFEIRFDRAFVAIGQTGVFQGTSDKTGFKVTEQGFVDVDESLHTNLPKVYAVGDVVSGPSSVVEAMAAGRKVAGTVHADMDGEPTKEIVSLRPKDKDFLKISEDIPSLARPTMPEKQPAVRKGNFSEVAIGLDEAQVILEAGRCLECGVCSECFQCVDACGAIDAINHGEPLEEVVEHAGVVIIADPEISPPIKGEDVIRAYGPRSAKSDVYAMFLRGFAAAARAMVLFGGTSHRPKRHGISFAPPEPELSPEIRLGVFVCRCNDSLGWVDGMSEYIEGMLSQEDVVHAEVMPAVCVPEGYSSILRTIREKGITRVALASCVCCPRNFVCSACSDQRSRLKDGLFTGTGISRSMVETCNLRGEVLALVKQDSSLAFARFAGLIDRSVRRARRLKPFSASARNYNFTTAVIGMSEAAYNSALTLAEAGLEVLLFGTPGKPLVDAPDHPNIHRFEGFLVKELSGTLGDFQVFVETGDFQQILQVGAVILSEKARKNIPYIHQDGLPGGIVEFDVQKGGVSGVSFFDPGETSISGLYLANPPGIHVSNRTKGAAAAVLAAAIMPSGPRQSVGFTAVVDENLCRGCGRCIRVCAYQAITLYRNAIDGWYASVDEALCRGCGNCISVCPSNAADSPYRNQAFLEQTLEEILMQ